MGYRIDVQITCKCKNCKYADAEKYKVCYCNVHKHIMDAKEDRKCKFYESRK